MRRRPRRFALFVVLAMAMAPGCALRFQTPARPQPVAATSQPGQNSNPSRSIASTQISSKKNCSDRVDGARVGSLTGTVLGTIVGAAFGMPWMGLAYKFAGSAIGFASGSGCAKNGVPKKDGKFVKPDDAPANGNGKSKGKHQNVVDPDAQPSGSIKEENI